MIRRDAFLYLEPKGDGADFAQCKTCRDFDPKAERCAIIGPSRKVTAEMSCGAYIPGKFEGDTLRNAATPKELGLVDRKVRCENCRYGGAICALYKHLNEIDPTTFDLDVKIKPTACCNANTAKGG